MTTTSFRRTALVAWVFQALIVLSGAAVRLTEAGLGCEDWPTCNEDRLTPEWELHGWIEFGNRLISLVVTFSAIAVVIAARRRQPRRGDVVTLAWLLAAGTAAQVVLGGITVLLDLNPVAVSGHFLLSMVLLVVAHLIWRRADPDGPAVAGHENDETTRLLLRAQLPLAGLVLFTGTLVTGSGPNSGDARADRLGLDLTEVARVHSISVWLFMACVVGLGLKLRSQLGNEAGDPRTHRWPILRLLALAGVAQGIVGYTQFALGVPASLVELHVAGAVVVWMLAVALHLRSFDRPEPGPTGPTAQFDGPTITETDETGPDADAGPDPGGDNAGLVSEGGPRT
ncbi:MAG: COX15/CtaA family protein [Actinomycetota bacterium]